MSKQNRLLAAAAACLVSHGALAQARPAAPTVIGTWRGTSLCLVRPSACNDETVVYRITRAGAGDSLSVDARKVVKGQEEEMGVLTCLFSAPIAQLKCPFPLGTWQFTERGDSLVGELRLKDGTKFRDIRTARSK